MSFCDLRIPLTPITSTALDRSAVARCSAAPRAPRQFPSARMRPNLLCSKGWVDKERKSKEYSAQQLTIFHGNGPVLVADMRNLFGQQSQGSPVVANICWRIMVAGHLSGLAMGPSCPSRVASNLTASLPLHQSGQTLVERTTWVNERVGGWGAEDSQ
jgi:hypothetical protein